MVNFFKRKEKDLTASILDNDKINPVTGFEFEPEDNVEVKPLNVEVKDQSNQPGLIKKAEELNGSAKEKTISEFVDEYYKDYDEKNTDPFKEIGKMKTIFLSLPQSQEYQNSLDEVIKKLDGFVAFEKNLFEITKTETIQEAIKHLQHKRDSLQTSLSQNMASGIPMGSEGQEIEKLSKTISEVIAYFKDVIKKGVKEDLEAQKFVLQEKLKSLQNELFKEIALAKKKKIADSENPNKSLKDSLVQQRTQIIK